LLAGENLFVVFPILELLILLACITDLPVFEAVPGLALVFCW
jgi:hypothetical protein